MSRNLPNRAPLPKAPFAAGVAIMGGMFYAVLLDAKGRQRETPDTSSPAEQGLSIDAETSLSAPSSVSAAALSLPTVSFLGGYGQVSAANVPPYVLASTNLDAEQKLQVRLRLAACAPHVYCTRSAGTTCARHVHVHGMCTACARPACTTSPGCAGSPPVLGTRLPARADTRAVQLLDMRAGRGGRPRDATPR